MGAVGAAGVARWGGGVADLGVLIELALEGVAATAWRPCTVTARERALACFFGSPGYQRLERRPDISSGTSRLVSGSFFAR